MERDLGLRCKLLVYYNIDGNWNDRSCLREGFRVRRVDILVWSFEIFLEGCMI